MLEDIMVLLQSFSMIDYLFFFAVVLLLILLVTLVYLIKGSDASEYNELEEITKAIQRDYKPQKIEFSDFEKEQELNAIISYKELLSNNKNYEINYIEEKNVDGLCVKKVNPSEIFVEKEV